MLLLLMVCLMTIMMMTMMIMLALMIISLHQDNYYGCEEGCGADDGNKNENGPEALKRLTPLLCTCLVLLLSLSDAGQALMYMHFLGSTDKDKGF